MTSPTPPDQPDQGLNDVPPDQGLNDVFHPTKSRTPLFIGIGAAVVVLIGILAAVLH